MAEPDGGTGGDVPRWMRPFREEAAAFRVLVWVVAACAVVALVSLVV